ncbi:NAD(P)/FAD-dependent oxidoreductase [Actinopolymorpha alba]|uniref:NAD(P)/FAD-dependent oxidoreductase n=1 Tax=Actinopolymorpha alba TaxID=533267 RepID=UPI000380CE40|nr:FAD-dependent oxidoreductase [Actinopolymorpha alba]
MPTAPTFVIVGASLAGARAAEALRAEGFDGRIVLVGEESERPYERPPLSKGVLLGNDEPSVAYVHPQEWYAEHAVELRLGVRAQRLDAGGHEVELADGDVLPYDKLLLTTGSSVRRLRVPGGDLDGVLYLRTMADSLRLKESFAAGARVVVVGAGWIGLEAAAAARTHGADVVVVEPHPTPLHAVLGPEMGNVFADLHRDHGVEFRFGQGVAEFRGAEGSVRAVVTEDGTELPADVVVVGIGIQPNTELAEAAGLAVDNGVLTDSSLQTSNPDVFAAGDVARWQSPLYGRQIRVEHWANAQDGGTAAGRSLLGGGGAYDAVPFFFTDQYDLGMEFGGDLGSGYDDVVVRGEAKAREFVAFWLRQGRVVAGMNVNVWDVQDDVQALIRSGRPVDARKLADGSTGLDSVYAG